MSDYLTRMAQLSRGEAAVVAPHLPSLFATTEQTRLTETIEPPPQYQTKAEPATQTTRESATETIKKDPSQQTTYFKPTAENFISSKQPNMQADITENGSTPLITPQNNNQAAPSIATPLLNENQAAPATTKIQPNSKLTPSSLADNLETIAPTKIDIAFDAVDDLNQQSDTVMRHSSLPLVPDYKNQQATPQQVMAELPATTEQIAKQEPTVHINIGRVEVRAQTAAPAPAPRPVRPKPQGSLSLNDYLKRGGGES